MASETREGGTGRADEDKSKGVKPERADPPVGTDGPVADSKKTVPLADLNSADDE